jgi:single-stranded-DNA-specific exonuclease
LNKRIWNLKEPNTDLVNKISTEYNLSNLSSSILVNRGVVEAEQIDRFLYPSRDKFYDPFLMADMKVATDRIIHAKNNNEKITIYGDYDVDGITSTSILYMFLKEIGCTVDYYIPDRLEEGYGVNLEAIKKIHSSGTNLIITVDTGITAIDEVLEAKQLGMDIIITDHHECQEQIPNATAVVNPKRKDCTYPFDMLAGVGVAFKLIHGISIKIKKEELIWKYLDIVAVGTIADIVPLCDENRIIVKLAFETMLTTWNTGLRALLKVADVKDKISSGMVGFRIAPRLNAAGRLGDAKRGVELFITDDIQIATKIAEELNEENNKRQSLEKKIYDEAIDIIEKSIDVNNTKVIVVASSGWHHGVIGIVASRIVEKYYRPTILLAIEDNIASGSARSVADFSIFEALSNSKDLLIKFGGHDMAAGMSLNEENVESLLNELNKYSNKVMNDTTLIPKSAADITINIDEISIPLIEEIKLMEPYGVGNEEPKIICSGNVNDIRLIGKNKNHLKLNLLGNNNYIDGIGFNFEHYFDYIGVNNNISILCTLDINEWNNKKSPQILMKDIKYHSEFKKTIKSYINNINNVTDELVSEWKKLQLIPERKDYESVYRYLIKLDKQLIYNIALTKYTDYIGIDKYESIVVFLICLEVFKELDLLEYAVDDNFMVSFKLFKGKKVELNTSTLYNKTCT